METYEERQIESLKGVIAEQQERIAELEAENERLKALIPGIIQVFRDAADKLEREQAE